MNNLYLVLALLLPLASVAGNDCQPIDNKPYIVKRFTNYAPSLGGINGRCGRSASGLDACKFTLEDHLKGRTRSVMGAVPQRGGTEAMFGGVYRAVALENKLGKPGCVKVVVADRYGKSSNNKSKMDIVTKKGKSKITQQVNAASGEMYILGRAKEVQKSKRKIRRLASVRIR